MFWATLVCFLNKLRTPLSRISKWASINLLTSEGYVVVRQLTRSATLNPSNLNPVRNGIHLPSAELLVLGLHLRVVLELVDRLVVCNCLRIFGALRCEVWLLGWNKLFGGGHVGALALLSFVTAKGIGVLGDLGRRVPEKYSNFTRQSTRFVANHIKYFYLLNC